MVLSWPGAFQHMNKRDLRKQQYSVIERKGEESRDARGIVYDQNETKKNPQNPSAPHLLGIQYMLDPGAAPPAKNVKAHFPQTGNQS